MEASVISVQEYVTGSQFIYWLKYHPNITKEKLYDWIDELVRQLCLIHRCRGNPCYRYVNPYCVVVTAEGKLYYADMEAKSNKELLRQIQRRSIREHFLPSDEPYYQKSSVALDIYGLGRTIQYLLSAVNTDPSLTRREEARFQKIISKCLKRNKKGAFKKASDIQKHIPIYKSKKPLKIINKKRTILVCIAAVCLIGAAIAALARTAESGEAEYQRSVSDTTENVSSAADSSMETSRETSIGTPIGASDGQEQRDRIASGTSQNEVLYETGLELALVYLLDLEQPERSLECLEKIAAETHPEAADIPIEDPIEDLRTIVEAAVLQKCTDSMNLSGHLQHLEEAMPEQNQERYYWCLVKGYALLKRESDDTEVADEEILEEILRLGQVCLDVIQEDSDEDIVPSGDYGKCSAEVREIMAAAYEDLGKAGEAAGMYEEVLQDISEDGKREELYKKISILYEDNEQPDMAMDTCVQGIQDCEESVELRILHIRMLCKDTAIDNEVCAQTVKDYMTQIPEILENEEFQKLQKEYGIQVEGEKVWIDS